MTPDDDRDTDASTKDDAGENTEHDTDANTEGDVNNTENDDSDAAATPASPRTSSPSSGRPKGCAASGKNCWRASAPRRFRSRRSTAVLATGTEIHEGVHRDLDSAMLAGLVRSWGHEATHVGSVPDEYETVRSTLAALAADHDVVVSTGATSVGTKDYVVAALAELGEVLFHRVRLRPGKPIAVADLPEFDAVAIAIPGKPIGAHAVTTLVARPFFTGEAALPTLSAWLTHAVDLPVSGFEYAIPVTLDEGVATPLGHVDSALSVYERTFDPSVLSSSTRASRADGFVLTDSALQADEQVGVVPYSAVER